jgi:predicted phosphodiesterase
VSWARGRDKVEVLREALENMGEFKGFDIKHLDDCFRDIDKLVPDDIDFVITGHTHQEKALCRREGEGFYYNGGTPGLVMRRPAVVSIEADGNATKGSVKRPRMNGTQLHLETVERSEFVRSK